MQREKPRPQLIARLLTRRTVAAPLAAAAAAAAVVVGAGLELDPFGRVPGEECERLLDRAGLERFVAAEELRCRLLDEGTPQLTPRCAGEGGLSIPRAR